jgi:CheY-like chemotaxis protein
VSVSLNERLRGLRELLSASLPASVQLVVDVPKKLWPVEADVSELELALLNLTVNARDAMPNGGSLSLTAENVTLTPGDGFDLAGDFVALKVSDTGVGIPADILPRVFDPFFTTKEVSKGTGLGLSQVYGFAQQSGGRIAVASELGQGTAFTLYLPRANAAPQAATQEQASEEAASGASILVVEDNPEVAEVAAGMLEQLGHKVQVVGSAAAAIAAVHERDATDLVFSDIVMAGELDGVGLARRLRAEHPNLPVLLATGYSQAAERIGDEFPILRKPYKMKELGQAVTAVLARGSGDGKLVRMDEARRARATRQER